MAVDLALGRGMTLAGGVDLALRVAPGIAGLALGGRGRLDCLIGCSDCLLRCFQRLPALDDLGAGALELVLDVGEAGTFGEAARGAGRRVCRSHEAVPAPDVAFQRHQPLTGLELAHEFGATFLGDDTDLGETPRQFRRRLHMGCE